MQPDPAPHALKVVFDLPKRRITLEFPTSPKPERFVITRRQGTLLWLWETTNKTRESSIHHTSIDAQLRILRESCDNPQTMVAEVRRESGEVTRHPESRIGWDCLRRDILRAAELCGKMEERDRAEPMPSPRGLEPEMSYRSADYAAFTEKEERRYQKRAAEQEELRKRMQEIARRKAVERLKQKHFIAAEKAKTLGKTPPPSRPSGPPAPAATPSVELAPPVLEFNGTTAWTASTLATFLLLERASLIWVSNQADDLLCLPACSIEQLEYQIRTALRAMGALRGNALLSDEVGLGKTIEAGLILKEYLTRGMVRRFLVLTVPSLVDQWAEELETKFGLATATTNQSSFKSDPEAFWTSENAVIASIHTFKQAHHLALATRNPWQLVIVDEAHYLRNRTSQAWQAVNALPRQFLLLLTATPVQNSIEELYNLVTLLRPGQLPSPKEFKARFVDPDRPRAPKEPEALRELLGQVMIRNTRANAGIKLPPRRAETVFYEPQPEEAEAWNAWDAELRECLKTFPAGRASLWGRLLLQTAGSSPRAWSEALTKFPVPALSQRWKKSLLLTRSFERRAAVIPPLAKTEGGVVVFTQFLATQSALVASLQAAKVPVWVLNGQTPPAAREDIARQFREKGGALLLTRSGTEGRNLQFCHRLVNFDLPWNPMEIEQRIGRLHRLGQERRVEVYNLVQTGTLQAHLLDILQEKLNLFELTVGETGLVLGDRFSSDDFEEEIFRRWRESDGKVAAALESLGNELLEARDRLDEIKKLDETLFANDYET